MSNAFRIEYNDGLGTSTLTLCRPDDGNRLTTSDMDALGQAVFEAGSRPTTKFVVIRAEGAHFCLGRAAAPKPATPPSALEVRERIMKPILDVYARVRATPVPVLAVVQGNAEGFGCALTGQSDLAIAADTARFSLPEMDNNLPPTLAISALLHKVPPKQLTHLVFTRESISAAEALAFDIVNKVVPAADLAQEAEHYIAQMADRNRRALCVIKEYMATAPYTDPFTSARLGANMLATVFSSPNDV